MIRQSVSRSQVIPVRHVKGHFKGAVHVTRNVSGRPILPLVHRKVREVRLHGETTLVSSFATIEHIDGDFFVSHEEGVGSQLRWLRSVNEEGEELQGFFYVIHPRSLLAVTS